MFSKKKKTRVQISAPSNFEHRVHTDFDEQEQKFVGLPRQWQSLIEDTAKRPKPFIDATVITTVEPRKVAEITLSFEVSLLFKSQRKSSYVVNVVIFRQSCEVTRWQWMAL